ncbi:hypothetical protein L7F22_019822 [Adiantum nelumboides]|nr:hypothetical protein [Adiantum nelumboides]
MGKGGFYAVRKGKLPGVYTTWGECEAQVRGFGGARYKKFSTFEEARRFVEETGTRMAKPSGGFRYNACEPDKLDFSRSRYYQAVEENNSSGRSDVPFYQQSRKREELPQIETPTSPPMKRICSDTESQEEEVEVYIKVIIINKDEAKWKLCFPEYVKDSKEYCSRGGIERNTRRAGLMAILRAIESHPKDQKDIQLHIYTNNEISVKCIKTWNGELQGDEYINLTEEGDLIKKCGEKIQNCIRLPILEYVKSDYEESTEEGSDQTNQRDAGWGDFEPFLSDDEEFNQIYFNDNKGKGKQL